MLMCFSLLSTPTSQQSSLSEHLSYRLQAPAPNRETALEGLFIQPPQHKGVYNCKSQFLVIPRNGSASLVEPWLMHHLSEVMLQQREVIVQTETKGWLWATLKCIKSRLGDPLSMAMRREKWSRMTSKVSGQVSGLRSCDMRSSREWSSLGREGGGELSWDY